MNDTPNPMSSAGGTIELGGKTFLLTQTRGADIEDFLGWLRSELAKLPSPVDAVKPSLEGLSEHLQEKLLERAYEDLQRQRQLDSAESRMLQSGLAGTAFLLWVHLRWKHPELSYDAVRILLADERIDVAKVQERLNELQKLSAEGLGSDPQSGPPMMMTDRTAPESRSFPRAHIEPSRKCTTGRRRRSRR